PRGEGVARLVDRAGRVDAGLPEVLLGENVGGDLRPVGRDFDVLQAEHDRSVGIANLGNTAVEVDSLVRAPPLTGVTTPDLHENLLLRPPSWKSRPTLGPLEARCVGTALPHATTKHPDGTRSSGSSG